MSQNIIEFELTVQLARTAKKAASLAAFSKRDLL